MKIAFLHYHLKPGGVTTVIQQQINTVQNDCDSLLLTGESPEHKNGFPCEVAVIPGLAYDQIGAGHRSPDTVARSILDIISAKWKTGCDLLHVHNPLLAKNANFLKILARLQESGVRLFLQVHDFAEDGRPWSYYKRDPYPADCHYGVINSRDYHILLKSGLKKEGLHKLPNMVNPFNIKPEPVIPADFVLYPIRAIRRKNIGEAMLLTLFFKDRDTLAITLPPNSPRDWDSYMKWKGFAKALSLNVIFEASDKYEFTDLVKSAKCMITTSITEGFGFAFLEPWTAEQPIAGRALPDICADFEQNGIRLDHLYPGIFIPVERIDTDRFLKKIIKCIKINYNKFNLKINALLSRNAFSPLIKDDRIDFAYLDEAMQQQVISAAHSDTGFRDELLRINPHLSETINIPGREVRIARNREAVLQNYNEAVYQRLLLSTYEKVIGTSVVHQIDKQALAYEFLKPKNFSLLKWSDDV